MLWVENYRGFKHKGKDFKFVIGDEVISRASITNFFDEFNLSCFSLFNRCDSWGFPFSGGWASQPFHIFQALDTMRTAQNILKAAKV
jgi:hypothetical protein